MNRGMWLFVILAGVAGAMAEVASAQGMSADYVRARAHERLSQPHGLGMELDILGYVPLFEQTQRVRSGGVEGDTLGYADQFNGLDFGAFPNFELRVRWTWHDSVELGYGFHILRSYARQLDEPAGFNGILYPPGVDAEYRSDWHDIRAHYRRDLLRMGLARNFVFYGVVGLEWAVLEAGVESETFPVEDDRTRESFRELLPWWNAGVGAELEIGQNMRFGLDVRGTYAVGYPTFQKRDNSNIKQSVVSLTGRLAFEYHLTDWFVLVARAKVRQMELRLYGGAFQADFEWFSIGPEIGIGIRL
jgi:hypothetical protein